jgi:hypothetical protein
VCSAAAGLSNWEVAVVRDGRFEMESLPKKCEALKAEPQGAPIDLDIRL